MTQQTFTSSTTFVVPAGVTTLSHLLKVAGGGAGGTGDGGGATQGGGGAGGVVHETNVTVVPGETLTITIGAGGTAPATLGNGGDGGNTTVVGSVSGALGVTAVGGGGGSRRAPNNTAPSGAGNPGGSGGGGGSNTNAPTYTPAGGTGTAGQGNAGGKGWGGSVITTRAGGGGGGAGAAGSDAVSPGAGGAGGAGVDTSSYLSGVGVSGFVGGGGGGGDRDTGGGPVPAGGSGGGGHGGDTATSGSTQASAGTANTGGGGGGASGSALGKDGGSGVVAFTYTIAAPGVPTSVTATPGETEIELSWGAPASGGPVSSYEVRIDGGTPTTATSPHTFTGLTASTSYALEVRAVGAGGSSSWVLVTVSTFTPTPPGYFRVELELGAHSWTIERGDPFAYGPLLPLTMGWDIPDTVDFFPTQANLTTLGFSVQCEEAAELADVVKGSTVTMRMYVSADPDADPWQTFDGVVTQLDGATVPPGTQARADAGELDFRVTVFAGDDNARLADVYVGYTDDWPVEHISERVERICDEAGITYAGPILAGLGMVGWLRDRVAGNTVSTLEALRSSLKDSADDYDSEPPFEFYGRYVFMYTHADTTLNMYVFRRRVFPVSGGVPTPGTTYTLDGGLVVAAGQWSKYPGPAAAAWVIVDGTTFGTPAGVPYVRSTSLFDTFDVPGDPVNHSATERDNLGESLLPDGSTALDGWSTRSLRYLAHLDPDPVTLWASRVPEVQATVTPVVITPLGPELELNDLDYLAGTLTGARLVIPAGGDFYLELRLRNELLPGTELP